MTTFSIEQAKLESQEIVILRDANRQRTVRIARHGAALITLEQTIGNVIHQLADGYRDAAEIASRPSSRFAIMAPFANRIDDARYTFDGQTYDLQPGVVGAERAARHGFVRGVDFDIAELHADETSARATFTTSVIRPGKFAGYPFAIDVTVTFSLDANGLNLTARMHNVGDKAAPCFFGWHPYFHLGDGGVDDWTLEIPADHLVRMNDQSIPLAGDDAYQPLNDAPRALDFRKAKPIGTTKIDNAYAHVAYTADGRAHAHLRNPANGIGVSVWQERGVTLAFTADTVTRDVRKSVAVEPMESLSNAFNRPDCADAIRLEPGAVREFRCGVEIDVA